MRSINHCKVLTGFSITALQDLEAVTCYRSESFHSLNKSTRLLRCDAKTAKRVDCVDTLHWKSQGRRGQMENPKQRAKKKESNKIFKTNLQVKRLVRSSLKWTYDSAQGLNKGLNQNMALMGLKVNVATKQPFSDNRTLEPKVPELYGSDSLVDSQTVDQYQRCTGGCDAVADTGRDEKREGQSHVQ